VRCLSSAACHLLPLPFSCLGFRWLSFDTHHEHSSRSIGVGRVSPLLTHVHTCIHPMSTHGLGEVSFLSTLAGGRLVWLSVFFCLACACE